MGGRVRRCRSRWRSGVAANRRSKERYEASDARSCTRRLLAALAASPPPPRPWPSRAEEVGGDDLRSLPPRLPLPHDPARGRRRRVLRIQEPEGEVDGRVKPGKYVEGVVVDGTERKKDFDGLTIEGTKKNPKRTILEGKNAKGELGAAQNGVEAISVDGLVLKNMWARNFQSNGFFIHAADEGGQHCVGYTMNNLLASANRSYGLFAKNCFGGKMVNSAGYHQGDSAFYVGETPCDSKKWNVYDGRPCQEKPQWTLLKNDDSYENVLGYSGTNSKYVKIVESAFYNNGIGIAPNTLDSEGYEPNGWLIIERNDVFWNNYNYFLKRSAFHTVSEGLGELSGQTVNYPTGVGIILYGSDHNLVRRNRVFGNYKWGIASFSGPGETFVANEGNEAQERQQRNRRKHDGSRRRRPERRIRHLERLHRRRQLLGRQQPQLDLRAGQRQSPAEPDLPDLPAGGGRIRGGGASTPPGCRSRASRKPATRRRSSATPAPRRRRTSSAPGSSGSPRTRRSRATSRSKSRPAR